ncbi:MAG: ATP-binding protein [Pirellulales bacterium]
MTPLTSPRPPFSGGPEPIAAAISDPAGFMAVLKRSAPHIFAAATHVPTPDEREAISRQRAEQERTREQTRRRQAWDLLARQLGPRYAGCTLDGFQVAADPATAAKQHAVLAKLAAYAERLDREADNGTNVVLYGCSGSGKDHLLTDLARTAILEFGLSVEWKNGMDLWGEVRDLIGNDHAPSERAFVARLAAPAVLWLSDVLPPSGLLTEFQTNTLFRVVDRRYRDCKPIWLSLNVADAGEASQRIGASVVDRIRDGAIALSCNWPSHRRSKS